MDPQRPPVGGPRQLLDGTGHRRRGARRGRGAGAELPACAVARLQGSCSRSLGRPGRRRRRLRRSAHHGRRRRQLRASASLIGAGILVAVIGWGVWRYDPLRRRGCLRGGPGGRPAGRSSAWPASSPPSSPPPLFNSDSQNEVGILLNNGFARSVFMIGLAVAGVLAVLVAAGKLPVWSPLAGIAISAVPADRLPDDPPDGAGRDLRGARRRRADHPGPGQQPGGASLGVGRSGHRAPDGGACVVLLAFFVRSESTSEKFRTQLFTVMLLDRRWPSPARRSWATCSPAARRRPDAAADKLGRRAAVGGRRAPDAGHAS